jgi:Cytochrome P460
MGVMMNGKLTLMAGALVLVGAATVTMAATPAPVLESTVEGIEALVHPADTTGAAVWSHIQEEEYRDNWDLWPGTEKFYKGNSPHGMLLTTYVNEVAFEALQAGTTRMPNGSVVIKENYMPNHELAAVTVMFKKGGYNPDFSDWFFTKHKPDGSLFAMPNGMAMEGRLPGCQGCHLAKKDADFLFTPRPN